MLKVHRRGDVPSDVADIGQDVIWIDLLNPNSEEKRSVERLLDVEIPDEVSPSEIEASSRMISEHGKLVRLPSAPTITA
jgi:magnesium transporter